MPNRTPKPAPQPPAPLPFPNPRTRAEVAANRRAYLSARPTLERGLTVVIVGVVALVAVGGALGSVYNLVTAAEKAQRSWVAGVAAWAGAEGIIVVCAALIVGAAWRGQVHPRSAAHLMWLATIGAVALNVAAVGGLDALTNLTDLDALSMLAVAAPLGTAGGIKGLSTHARSTLDMRTGADQHAAAAAHLHKIVRARAWATRAAAWQKSRTLGGASRYMARRRVAQLAVDDPEIADMMRAQVATFVEVDAAFTTPALAAAPATEQPTHDAEAEADRVTLERVTAEEPPAAASVPAPRRPELPPVVELGSFDNHVRGVYAAMGVTPSASVVTVRVPLEEQQGDEADPGEGGLDTSTPKAQEPEPEPEHAKADVDHSGTDNGNADKSMKTPEVTSAVDTNADTSTGNDEADKPQEAAQASKAERLAAANKARAERARADRKALAERWYEALDADPDLTKKAFVESAGASRQTLSTAITENPRATA